MPSCVGDGGYGMTIDPATGHPTPVPALIVDNAVSDQLARPWSVQMSATGSFAHRPSGEARAIYDQLGIVWSSIGENIAWMSGYPESQAAQIFFSGWRESDTGHYCAMLASTFTHFGVGYHHAAGESWGTQNFYRPR